jgi:hypothetical protein
LKSLLRVISHHQNVKIFNIDLDLVAETDGDISIRLNNGLYRVVYGEHDRFVDLDSDTILNGQEIKTSLAAMDNCSALKPHPCRSVLRVDGLENGEYDGKWGGFIVNVLLPDGTWSKNVGVDKIIGPRTCACKVRVEDGWVFPY